MMLFYCVYLGIGQSSATCTIIIPKSHVHQRKREISSFSSQIPL